MNATRRGMISLGERSYVHIAPLALFRIAFGLMMFAGILRFWLNGWITDLYVMPKFFFPYAGFEWVRPMGSTSMHIVFAVMALASLLMAAGLWYRVAAVLFFLTFTYTELLDVTNYLNHYYFISIVSFLLIWLPANRYAALDSYFKPETKRTHVPRWTIDSIKLQLGMVYFFAGLAKINSDWLLHALPLKIWLPAKSHLPIIGSLMYEDWVAYAFSWFGCLYDLLIVFFLLNKKTRPVAYGFVLVFHLATAIFFPGIGMFPYVMIVSSLIFFDAGFHKKILSVLPRAKTAFKTNYTYRLMPEKIIFFMLGLFFLLQIFLPFRYLLYPGKLFWGEEGYRFSWRVMLMEKSGNSFFYVKDPASGRRYEVNNKEFLTPLQEKMMSTQPDMMVRYAHHLADEYAKRNIAAPQVFAESYVALNGSRSALFVDTTVNLAAQPIGWGHYEWILPYPKQATK